MKRTSDAPTLSSSLGLLADRHLQVTVNIHNIVISARPFLRLGLSLPLAVCAQILFRRLLGFEFDASGLFWAAWIVFISGIGIAYPTRSYLRISQETLKLETTMLGYKIAQRTVPMSDIIRLEKTVIFWNMSLLRLMDSNNNELGRAFLGSIDDHAALAEWFNTWRRSQRKECGSCDTTNHAASRSV